MSDTDKSSEQIPGGDNPIVLTGSLDWPLREPPVPEQSQLKGVVGLGGPQDRPLTQVQRQPGGNTPQ